MEPNSHDFRGIFENDIPLYITDAIQKSVFKADETGTEAAVASGMYAVARLGYVLKYK